MGHRGLQKFCGTMSLPVMKRHYSKIEGTVRSKMESQAQKALNDAADNLSKTTQKKTLRKLIAIIQIRDTPNI